MSRGGIPVAGEVATVLNVELDVVVPEALRSPECPELVYGAITEDGIRALDVPMWRTLSADPDKLARIESEAGDLARKEGRRLRGRGPVGRLDRRTAVIVDDCLEHGVLAWAACRSAFARGAVRTVVAAPVGTCAAVAMVADHADNVVCPHVVTELPDPDRYFAWHSDRSIG
ncbi:phosphoribosyltransferase [Nocardia sp. NPDC127526]|uniref:phosphoribosyltransferase n=1 Tax=Nocardia sp. NPDC127526 TaxID=3345393 RepID=UPI003632D849